MRVARRREPLTFSKSKTYDLLETTIEFFQRGKLTCGAAPDRSQQPASGLLIASWFRTVQWSRVGTDRGVLCRVMGVPSSPTLTANAR